VERHVAGSPQCRPRGAAGVAELMELAWRPVRVVPALPPAPGRADVVLPLYTAMGIRQS
jgi:hypothetical protein